MTLYIYKLASVSITCATLSFAQATFDSPFQVKYASNLILNGGDAVINVTNTGASATTLLTPGQTGNTPQQNIDGSICVNIYTFAADEQEVSCCSCLITPDALWSASVDTALLNSTITPAAFPNEVVVKLISTMPYTGTTGPTCNPGMVSTAAVAGNANGTGAGALAPGLFAWGTTIRTVPTPSGPALQLAEAPFVPATLTTAELARDVQECQFIQILGSGQFGICKGCNNSGLGAAAQ